MARIRTVKPDFWNDQRLSRLPALTRLVFLCLISMADDEGRIEGDAETVWHFGFPREDSKNVLGALQELSRMGRIVQYTGGETGGEYISIPTFTKHQRIDKPSRSQLPAPPKDTKDSKNAPRTLQESSKIIPAGLEGIGREGKGGEGRLQESPPRFASLHPDPDPDRDAAQAVADALNEDLALVQRVLRELALKGVSRDQAVRIALDLDGPIGAWDFKAHALKVAAPNPTPAAPDHGARPPTNGKALETAAAHAADAERLKAEFDASGYVDRNAWNADRHDGTLRSGPAAARRRWSLPLKAHDAE